MGRHRFVPEPNDSAPARTDQSIIHNVAFRGD